MKVDRIKMKNILHQMYKDVRFYGYATHYKSGRRYTDTRIFKIAERLGIEIDLDFSKWEQHPAEGEIMVGAYNEPIYFF